MPLNILNVVQLGCEWIPNINDENLPVGLTLIEQGHDTEDLDLLDLADESNLFADLANVQRIIVTLRLGLGVGMVRVLPGLGVA